MSNTVIILLVVFGGFFGILILAGIIVAILYNSLIDKKNQVDYAFGGMDVMLKKRYDLIPNLVKTVQKYAIHERELLEKITNLRSQAVHSNLSNEEKINLDNQLSGTIGQIMVAVESYPDLKANQNFLHLQASLNEVEEQISAARRAYNATVTDYNNGVEMFPTNIIAGMMRLKRKQVFTIAAPERQNVNVGELFW
ncbi:LemA family protein [Candidatus Halobeggiatoa sp. HSG11]|nr:LemA family protein [Candidatus Halobeggiatoa sp. HSG11]